jgi:hypothetical protein
VFPCHTVKVGRRVIRILMQSPVFELVATLVARIDEHGRDVGQLVGFERGGITATSDFNDTERIWYGWAR